jgi:hypothetical protein
MKILPVLEQGPIFNPSPGIVLQYFDDLQEHGGDNATGVHHPVSHAPTRGRLVSQ